jgi:hypothetical protein
MRFFLSPAADRPPGVSWGMTLSYFEIATTTANVGTSYLYVSGATEPDTILVSACLGEELLSWVPIVEGPQYGRAWRHAISQAYPRIGALLTAAVESPHSDMIMSAGHDPDDQQRKWSISLRLRDLVLPPMVNETNAQAFLNGERLHAGYATVLSESLAALREVTEDGLSKIDKDAPHRREFVSGVRHLQKLAPALERFQNA